MTNEQPHTGDSEVVDAIATLVAFLDHMNMSAIDSQDDEWREQVEAADEALKTINAALTSPPAPSETAIAYKREYEAFIEREAACCPEDVGFEEFIAVLRKRAEKAEADLAEVARQRDAYRERSRCLRNRLRNSERLRLASPPAPSGWQPIENVDVGQIAGQPMFGFEKSEKVPHVMRWVGMGWTSIPGGYNCHPTHVMPLPPNPGAGAMNHCSQATLSGWRRSPTRSSRPGTSS